jgi:zinc protease
MPPIPVPTVPLIQTVLDNGLRIVIVESHHLPIVTSSIWYHVGSAHEVAGQTGIAHFLEHLLFKGTPTYPKGMVDRVTASAGGHNNAGTIYDYTMYYFNFSADRWEIALEIEADRMRNCLLDPTEVDAERQVILEELSQQEDTPWGKLGLEVEAALFPKHPYQHPPIGARADLEQINPAMLRAFYETYYVPNNATLIVVGDIQAATVIPRIEALFRQIKPGVIPPLTSDQPTVLKAAQRIELVQDTNLKRLQIGYLTTPLTHADTYPLEVIDYLLSHGRTSRLYQRLIEDEQLVTFADTHHNPRKLHGVFYLFAELRPHILPEQVETILDAELARLATTPVEPAELAKIQHVIAADCLFEQETMAGIAHELGEYAVLDTCEYFNTYVTRIQHVTPVDIQRVAQTYFTPANRVVGWSLPSGPETEEPVGESADMPAIPALHEIHL